VRERLDKMYRKLSAMSDACHATFDVEGEPMRRST
jgi:hypothetical protein